MKTVRIAIILTVMLSSLTLSSWAQTDTPANPAQENIKSDIIELVTNQGTIKIKLFPAIAPKTCENFIGLINKGYYDGLTFHRVIPGFMIQGGDPTGTGRGGESLWGGKFEDEFSDLATFNKPGILAMANAGPGTNGSQFFITVAETSHLNNHHTIFGEVIAGMDAVDKIANVSRDGNNKPLEDQKIIKATASKE